MKRVILLLLTLCFSFIVEAQTKTTTTPSIFQEGIISKGDYESHPAFTPTGDTLYFIKLTYDLKYSAIYVSYKRSNIWTPPLLVPFSGKYVDYDPFISKDGKTLFFASNRPLKEGDPIKTDSDIWKVKMTTTGWSAPIHLESPVNSPGDEYYPTVADNGTIYFGSTRTGGKGGCDIYSCKDINGRFAPAQSMGDSINTDGNEFEGFIAPDESYYIFSAQAGSGYTKLDYYISYNNNGTWTKAKKLPYPISSDGIDWSPKVTRDGKYFYFSSTRSPDRVTPEKAQSTVQFNNLLQRTGNGLGDIYLVDFSIIKSLK